LFAKVLTYQLFITDKHKVYILIFSGIIKLYALLQLPVGHSRRPSCQDLSSFNKYGLKNKKLKLLIQKHKKSETRGRYGPGF
jgi:hypothetical protein